MSEMSNYLENAMINAVLRNTTYTSPTTVYVSLHTADPGETGANELSETNGYARQSATFSAPSDGVTSNSGAITFTASGGSWGTVTHFAIWDASTAGNCLFHSVLDASKTVGDGDSVQFASTALSVTLA